MKTCLSLSSLFLFILPSICIVAQEKKTLPVNEFEKTISKQNVQLLDVRTMKEFSEGHLKNAMLADWQQKKEFENSITDLDKHSPVLVYCFSGRRSADAATYLRKNGFTQVFELEGGISTWKDSGKELQPLSVGTAMSLSDYQQASSSFNLVLVEFCSSWLPACKKMETLIEDFTATYAGKVKVIKFDGQINSNLMKDLKLDNMPACILYRDGMETGRIHGVATKDSLTRLIEK